MKVQYPKHVLSEDDNICTHGVKYGLGDPDAREKPGMECDGCRFVPYFFDELRAAMRANAEQRANAGLDEESDEVSDLEEGLKVVDACEHKTALWRAQCVRVACQQQRIAAELQRMEKECLENKSEKPLSILVTMDYKASSPLLALQRAHWRLSFLNTSRRIALRSREQRC